MLSDDELQQKVNDTLKQANEIIGDAKARLGEMEALFRQHNLPPDFAQKILNSDLLTPDQKAKAKQEIASFEDELANDLRAAEDLAKSQRRKSKGPRRGIRI